MASNRATLDRINRAARGDTGPDQDTRREWAGIWSARISAMLEAPAKKNAPGRIWRLRYFQDDDYLVATLVQNITPPPGVPGQQAPRVVSFLTRPYVRANMAGSSTVSQQLFGEFSCDDIVAFLRLDLLDPDAKGSEWRDETKYSDILIVSDVIGKLGKHLH